MFLFFFNFIKYTHGQKITTVEMGQLKKADHCDNLNSEFVSLWVHFLDGVFISGRVVFNFLAWFALVYAQELALTKSYGSVKGV